MKRTKEIGYELLRVVDMDGFMEIWNRTDTETKDKIVNAIGELAVKLVSGADTSERQLTIPDVVGQSEQLLAFAQYLHNHSYVNKGFKPETLVRRFKGE